MSFSSLCDAMASPTVRDAAPELRSVLSEAIAEVVWSGYAGGRGLRACGNIPRLCGCDAEQLLTSSGVVWIERADPADYARVDAAYRTLLVSGVPFDEEYRFVRWDGSRIWVRGRLFLRPGVGAPILDGVFVDVTERRELQEEIVHLQKLEAVGEFTGGIVHDFNNLLAVILANTTLLLDALDEGDRRRVEAAAALEAAERAAGLTRRLLPFTRTHVYKPSAVDLSEVVRRAEQLLRRVIGKDIEIVAALAAALPSVRADDHLLEQIIMNLAINARDAMPNGGTLRIETSCIGGTVVRLAVSDTGCGMDADCRRHVFDRFFTTKAPGEGTGLGLTVAQSIVRQFGGSITVESEVDKGSVFEVLLPAMGEVPALRSSAATSYSFDLCGSEQVLLVEDDVGVRELVQRMLTKKGYHVQCARDAEEALTAVQTTGAPFDLLLSDVIMPHGNGNDLADSVQRRSAATRTLFMSGHSIEWLDERGILDRDQPFIHKPFTPVELARRVREVLDA